MLILTNDDVMQVLTMRDCMAALEEAFQDLHTGDAVERPRSHTYTPLEDDRYYLFKSMDGGLKRHRVHAIRMSSDMIQEVEREGTLRREKIPAAEGGNWVGMILLFSMDRLEPLALVQDGYLQRTRVGATSGLAAKYLTPEGVTEAGLVGTGWQAGAQIIALKEALPDLKKVSVYSRNRERREEFCRVNASQVPFALDPVNSSAEAVQGKRLWVLATNALEPVADGNWLLPDSHVNSLQGREMDWATLARADRVIARAPATPTHWAPAGFEPAEMRISAGKGVDTSDRMIMLGSVIAGGFKREPGWVTLFGGSEAGGSAGLGIQFAAVANVVYRRAREAGLGFEVDGKWLRQGFRP
ncbi:MAG: ornithine cyclodeaminase family protein [Chloroflexi bacterium]|nr:ornithine cyclodeaminase family protein [Chloroflexota bacterium]